MRAALLLAVAIAAVGGAARCNAQPAPASTVAKLQESVVKVYGAGGMSGLEAYQSGFISTAEGHVVTADTLVLEQGEVTVVLNNGDRFSGRVLGADRLLRVAVVKIDPAGEELEFVDLNKPAEAAPGQTLLVLSNLFNIATGNEPASVMRTRVAGFAPRELALGAAAPRGKDRLLLIDTVTSNPGAAGGLLADYRGACVGMIGVEQRGRVTGGWLNYALPARQVAASAGQIINGERLLGARQEADLIEIDTLDAWGFVLVEAISPRTAPYVEYVRPGSHADQAGIRADDLLVMVDGLVTGAAPEAVRVLTLRCDAGLTITLERGGELIEATLPEPSAKQGGS